MADELYDAFDARISLDNLKENALFVPNVYFSEGCECVYRVSMDRSFRSDFITGVLTYRCDSCRTLMLSEPIGTCKTFHKSERVKPRARLYKKKIPPGCAPAKRR